MREAAGASVNRKRLIQKEETIDSRLAEIQKLEKALEIREQETKEKKKNLKRV